MLVFYTQNDHDPAMNPAMDSGPTTQSCSCCLHANAGWMLTYKLPSLHQYDLTYLGDSVALNPSCARELQHILLIHTHTH